MQRDRKALKRILILLAGIALPIIGADRYLTNRIRNDVGSYIGIYESMGLETDNPFPSIMLGPGSNPSTFFLPAYYDFGDNSLTFNVVYGFLSKMKPEIFGNMYCSIPHETAHYMTGSSFVFQNEPPTENQIWALEGIAKYLENQIEGCQEDWSDMPENPETEITRSDPYLFYATATNLLSPALETSLRKNMLEKMVEYIVENPPQNMVFADLEDYADEMLGYARSLH